MSTQYVDTLPRNTERELGVPIRQQRTREFANVHASGGIVQYFCLNWRQRRQIAPLGRPH